MAIVHLPSTKHYTRLGTCISTLAPRIDRFASLASAYNFYLATLFVCSIHFLTLYFSLVLHSLCSFLRTVCLQPLKASSYSLSSFTLIKHSFKRPFHKLHLTICFTPVQ